MIESKDLKRLATGEHIYRPSNMNKLPDLVQVCVNKGILQDFAVAREDIEAAAKFFNDKIQCQGWNSKPENERTLEAYDCSVILKQEIEGKNNSVEIGTDYEHPQVRDYVTQQHRNTKNSSIITKMLHPNIPTKTFTYRIPLEIDQRTEAC